MKETNYTNNDKTKSSRLDSLYAEPSGTDDKDYFLRDFEVVYEEKGQRNSAKVDDSRQYGSRVDYGKNARSSSSTRNPSTGRGSSAGNSRRVPPTQPSNRGSSARNRNIRGESAAERRAKRRAKQIRNFVLFMSALIILFVAYLGVSLHFTNHFLFNTQINGEDFSRKTPDDVREFFNESLNDYVLTIIDVDGQRDIIRGSDIGLSYHDSGEIEAILEEQNPFGWLPSFFSGDEIDTVIEFDFDSSLLNQQIQRLGPVTKEQTPPISAFPVFDGEYFVIEPEVSGTAIDVGQLRTLIHEAVATLVSEIDLSGKDLYEQPQFTSESPEVIYARDTLNTFIGTSITYPVETYITIDGSDIIDWVSYDNDLNPILDEDRVAAWVDGLAESVDTVGITRYLSTPEGRSTQVSGGYYGWRVDREAETEALIANIRQGDVLTREPIFSRRGAVHGPNDWGNTFVQVDLSTQHMWYFLDGAVIFDSPVVTGRPGALETPAGVFFIQEMEEDSVLSGATNPYTGVVADDTEVAYWMRITWDYPVPGIGFHDAEWQSSFGGTRYRTHGSHGCINMPLDKASELFSLISEHTPVVVHH